MRFEVPKEGWSVGQIFTAKGCAFVVIEVGRKTVTVQKLVAVVKGRA